MIDLHGNPLLTSSWLSLLDNDNEVTQKNIYYISHTAYLGACNTIVLYRLSNVILWVWAQHLCNNIVIITTNSDISAKRVSSLFISFPSAHAVFERSTDKEWHNPSGTFLTVAVIRWNKVAWMLATQRQEELSVNNKQSFIVWCSDCIQ